MSHSRASVFPAGELLCGSGVPVFVYGVPVFVSATQGMPLDHLALETREVCILVLHMVLGRLALLPTMHGREQTEPYFQSF